MKTVDIVLATYKPNRVYFKKLLKSLNSQTYNKINLIVIDDSGDIREFKKINNIIKKNINKFKYEVFYNDKNLGSNKTFEKLTKKSSSHYIAYCDQDDIWEDDKIAKLIDVLVKENALLVYSDLSVIDENDKLIANSFKKIHKRLRHLKGDNLFELFLRRNSVTGCTMLIKSEVAKNAIPFCSEFYVHDHWLTIFASSIGRVAYIEEPLVKYRIHEGNQIGASMLSEIEDREDYYRKKLLKERMKFEYLLDINKFNNECSESVKKVLDWTEERILFFENKNMETTISMIRKIKDDYQLILFEMAINFFPNVISKKIINKVKQ